MSTVNLLLTDNFPTLVFQGTLQEGNFALPESRGDPVVSLLVEESKIRNLLWTQVYHVFGSLVVEDTA